MDKIEDWLERNGRDFGPGGKLPVGSVIGDWRVVVYLGCGLSAEVYRVINVRYGHAGALKLLVDGSRGLRERFLDEADAIRSLSLRSLPRFMGSGLHEGNPYYVMEYLMPLPDPMPRREVPSLMNRVAKAVDTLHEAGYIHRDLKPGNLMMRSNGEPVLIDLGLIKRRGEGVADPIVRHGRGISIIDGKPVGVGTLDYAAPEQLLRGESSVQSDIFALGKILRTLYGGKPPRNIKSVIRKATRELPEDRFKTANDFAAAIRHRHYPMILSLVAAMVLGTLLAIGIVFRHEILGIDSPGVPKVSVVQKAGESDEAYLKRLLPAAEGGFVPAQIVVAEMYFHGRGCARDRAESVKWYGRAAKKGDPAAQASLGLCYLWGWGCEKNKKEAFRWYLLAASQDNVSAMNDIAYCYMNGIGTELNRETGFYWALRAAKAGSVPAETMVGECYLDGKGVAKDVEEGEAWLFKAAQHGNKRARELLEKR